MTPQAARRSAATIAVACAAASVGALVLLGVGLRDSTPGDDIGVGEWGGFGFVISALAFGAVGSLLVARMPGNRVGWLLGAVGLALAVGDAAYQYADQTLYGPLQQLRGGSAAALLQNLAMSPALGPVGIALLLFPDGRVPARRWKLAVATAVAGSALIVIGYALRPGPLDPPFTTVANPIGVPGAFAVMDATSALGYLFTGLSLVFAALALRSRLRRAAGLERQQLKWVALAAVVAGLFITPYMATYFMSVEGINQVRDVALGMSLSAFPVAAGIAITRHRLYDIDVVVNRTLVYAVLTASLAAVYLASVLLLQLALRPFTAGSSLAIAASTLAVAALFRPARARIQDAVDRRFFRSKYDAARTLDRFGARMRDQVDVSEIATDLLAVVKDTVQPAQASLWLHAPGDPRDPE